MKVKCCNCGLVREAVMGEGICPECGGNKWCLLSEVGEGDMVSLAKEFLRVVKEEGIKIVKKEEVTDETMMEATMKAREETEKTMNKIDPFHYRKKCKKEGLAFEIIDIKDGNKVRVRKIYLNGHIEGFKGNPLVTNYMIPKIMALKALLKQMNKDYRDLIEAYTMRGLPLDQVPLHELYMREMEGIDNIKI